MRWIEWVEPFIGERPLFCRVPEDTAVLYQRELGTQKGYTYPSDAAALDDFITVHWARIVEGRAT